jgi:hypothetical protein
MIWYSIYFKDLFHCTASHVISIMYKFAMLLPWGIPIVYKVYLVIWYAIMFKLCKFDDNKTCVFYTFVISSSHIMNSQVHYWIVPRFLWMKFMLSTLCLKYNMVSAKCGPQWTSTHQCTIHWMLVIIQLWMNINWVNIWFHLGNPFCKK